MVVKKFKSVSLFRKEENNDAPALVLWEGINKSRSKEKGIEFAYAFG